MSKAIMVFGCFDLAIFKLQEIAVALPIRLTFPVAFATQEAHSSTL